ncbi:hypothetical protein FACS1894142_5430 [Spirochaetia bacterium]|nr:hypothetical protein FACS1894142_5430 [Spirochaetia bacterium]
MKKIIEYFKNHYFISLIILYIIIMVLWQMANFVLYGLVSGFIISLVIVIIAKLTGYINIFGFRKTNLIKCLLLGSPALLAGIYVLMLSLTHIKSTGMHSPDYFTFSLFFLWAIGSGLFEEIFMRGIILNILIKNCKKSKLFSIIMASCVFGLTHLYNIFNGLEYINGVISQVIYTIVMGIFKIIPRINISSNRPEPIAHKKNKENVK